MPIFRCDETTGALVEPKSDTYEESSFLAKLKVNLPVFLWMLLSSVFIVFLTTDVQAQTQANSQVQYVFGQNATFDLILESPEANSNYMLFIRTSEENISSQSVIPTQNKITYTRDLREQPFLPFSTLTFWWEYIDSDNNLIVTEKKNFQYSDNRFDWQTFEDNDIFIYWVNGEKATMMNAAPIIREAAEEIQHALQINFTPVMRVYIYPSQVDLQSALQLAGYKWVAGATYPELGVILLAVPDNLHALSQMQRTLPHEVTHKMLYDAFGPEGYKHIPTWLEEGLATYFEPNPDPTYALALAEANENNTVLRLESLCYPFLNEPTIALLSYAQSESITRYILQKYGWTNIRNLIERYTQESIACSTGLENVLGIQASQFEKDWRVWMQNSGRVNSNGNGQKSILQFSPEIQAAISVFMKDGSQWLLVGCILIAPFLFFCIQFIFKDKNTK